jgi:hypothetical protein
MFAGPIVVSVATVVCGNAPPHVSVEVVNVVLLLPLPTS